MRNQLTINIFFLFTAIGTLACEHHNDPSNSNEGVQTTDSIEKGDEIAEIVNYSSSESVTSALLDKKGNLWFGTNSEGIYHYDGKTFVHYSEKEGLCSNHVTALSEDYLGNLWIGTDNGLCKYDGSAFTHIPIPWDGNENLWGEGMNAKKVLTVLGASNGDIWIGTWGAGAYRYDGTTFTNYLQDRGKEQSDGLKHNVIQNVFEDAKGNIWFTSMTHGGVSKYDGETFTHISIEDGLSDDMVRSAMEDSEGNLWFGALGNREGGLDCYDGENFTHFNIRDGLNNSNVTCIYEDRKGRVWVGSGRGNVSVLDKNNNGKPSFSTFKSANGTELTGILTIIEDVKGNLWFGGKSGQLWQLQGETLTDFTQKGRI